MSYLINIKVSSSGSLCYGWRNLFKRKPTIQAENGGAKRFLVDIEELSSWLRSRVIGQGIKVDLGLCLSLWDRWSSAL